MGEDMNAQTRIVPGDRLVRLSEVLKRVPFGKTTVYERIRAGTFPAQQDCGGGVVAWYESEINDWLSRPATWRATVTAQAA